MHWDRYPEHVRDRTLKAYRPVLIQVRISNQLIKCFSSNMVDLFIFSHCYH